MKKRKNGFTLVEILIAMAILVMLMIAMVGIINPIALVNRANDGLRKKNLNRIKTAFEEYYNDKGYYPDEGMLDKLTDSKNCGTNVFAPWLNQWPCDPLGQTFYIDTETDAFNQPVIEPKWFKVFTNLQDKKDKNIPSGWYSDDSSYHLKNYSKDEVNFGVSSSNVLWYDYEYSAICNYHPEDHSKDICFIKTDEKSCNAVLPNGCSGSRCYSENNCSSLCQVPCCGSGCD